MGDLEVLEYMSLDAPNGGAVSLIADPETGEKYWRYQPGRFWVIRRPVTAPFYKFETLDEFQDWVIENTTLDSPIEDWELRKI